MPLTLLRPPLLKGKTVVYPKRAICPVCGRKRVFEPHAFAALAFGALPNTRNGAGVDELDGFLNLVWHDGHSDVDRPPFVYVTVPVADDVKGGQGELYFCSTPCLRRFFTGLVDEPRPPGEGGTITSHVETVVQSEQTRAAPVTLSHARVDRRSARNSTRHDCVSRDR